VSRRGAGWLAALGYSAAWWAALLLLLF